MKQSIAHYGQSYGCYHPANMQVRYMIQQKKSGHLLQLKDPKTGAQLISPTAQAVQLNRAKQALVNFAFIGIADFFYESMCLLALLMPPENGFLTHVFHSNVCNCSEDEDGTLKHGHQHQHPVAVHIHHVTHHTPAHIDVARLDPGALVLYTCQPCIAADLLMI